MSKQTKQKQNQANSLTDIALIFPTIVFLTISVFYFRLDISVTLAFLFGVWVLDGSIKKHFGFGNETLFADLSFSSFIFVAGQAINLVHANSIPSIDKNNLIRVSIIAFVLLLSWILNLIICQNLINGHSPHSKKLYFGLWGASCVFALFSASFAVAIQVLNMI